VTLFPRVYQEVAAILEMPDIVLVIAGTLDMRGGALQMRAEAVKKASLATMIRKAKDEGFFDEEEAARGFSARIAQETDEETMEMVDEEGNVIAGEMVSLKKKEELADDFLGPLGRWIVTGMKEEEAMRAVGLAEENSQKGIGVGVGQEKNPSPSPSPSSTAPNSTNNPDTSSISVHTIPLPPRAPRQLLLDHHGGMFDKTTWQDEARKTIKEIYEGYIENLKKIEAEETNPLLKTQIAEYGEFIKSFTSQNAIMNKSFFVVVPFDGIRIPGAQASGSFLRDLFPRHCVQKLFFSSSGTRIFCGCLFL
jgi:hypothetical protein